LRSGDADCESTRPADGGRHSADAAADAVKHAHREARILVPARLDLVALDDSIRLTAEQNGVQQQFWDIFGKPHITTVETNRAILTALGLDCSSEEALWLSAERLAQQDSAR